VSVLSAVIDHLELEANIGGYEAASARQARLDAVYDAAAALIGARPEEIALVESATVAWRRFVDSLRLGPGDRVLATRSTYVSSALQLLELERGGLRLELIPNDANGQADVAALAAALERPASLLAATHVPTSSGAVEPVAEIGALARAAGVPYLLDATQSAGQLPIDVAALGCDALVTTGRKYLRAPRGTGFLYVASEMCARLRPVAPDVRGAVWSGEHSFQLTDTARRFETFEAAHALRLGLGCALEETLALGVDAIASHVIALASLLRERLVNELPNLRILDPPCSASAIVTCVREGEDPRATQETLAGANCHVVVVPAAHGFWDLGTRGLPAVVRASVHVYNGEDDVDAMIEALSRSARKSRVTLAESGQGVDRGSPPK
jgi:selenocysteine lyase/cysteine desulfurase